MNGEGKVTDKRKAKLDAEMMLKWERYVYKEITNESNRDFRHINIIIGEDAFLKVYLNNSLSLWVFILCDGEYGFFDGYTWHEYIPRSLAEFMGENILNVLLGKEFEEIDGKFYVRKNSINF